MADGTRFAWVHELAASDTAVAALTRAAARLDAEKESAVPADEVAQRDLHARVLARLGEVGSATTAQLAEHLQRPARGFGNALAAMRRRGLLTCREVRHGRDPRPESLWSLAPALPAGEEPQPRRSRMLPIYEVRAEAQIHRYDCRRETQCVSDAAALYDNGERDGAKHCECPPDCAELEPIPHWERQVEATRMVGMLAEASRWAPGGEDSE